MNHSMPTSQGSEQVSLLLKLPTEVQVKIYTFASKHTGAIKPDQWLPGSAKFAHDCQSPWMYSTECLFGDYRTYYRNNLARTNGRLPEALTTVDLSATCRFIYNIVIGDFLLYKLNDFEFRNSQAVLAYLTAILPRRRNAIRNISVIYAAYMSSPAPAFTVLSICNGLRNLTLDISDMPFLDWPVKPGVMILGENKGYAALIKLRGLGSLKLVCNENEEWNVINRELHFCRQLPLTEDNKKDVRNEIRRLESDIEAIVTRARDDTLPAITMAEIDNAMTRSGIPATAWGYKLESALSSGMRSND
jgi:hypothetical protein